MPGARARCPRAPSTSSHIALFLRPRRHAAAYLVRMQFTSDLSVVQCWISTLRQYSVTVHRNEARQCSASASWPRGAQLGL